MTHTAQHTPGLWAVKSTDEDINTKTIIDSHEFWIAKVLNFNRASDDIRESQANANLIAAAPAMYEALKDLIGDLGDLHGGSIAELQCHWCGRDYEDEEAGGLCTSDDCPGYIARQAIAQAEGRHP